MNVLGGLLFFVGVVVALGAMVIGAFQWAPLFGWFVAGGVAAAIGLMFLDF